MIEVNGKFYERKPTQRSNFYKLDIIANMLSFNNYYGLSSGLSLKRAILPHNVNIIKEFGLIEQKKSNLSSSQRKEVVYLFNKAFKEVKNDN